MDVLEIGELLVEMARQQQRGIGEVAFGNLDGAFAVLQGEIDVPSAIASTSAAPHSTSHWIAPMRARISPPAFSIAPGALRWRRLMS